MTTLGYIIPQNEWGIFIIKNLIYRDYGFDHSTVKVINENNYLAVIVDGRYDTTKIEVLPIKYIYIGDKIHSYDTDLDLLRIFKTG